MWTAIDERTARLVGKEAMERLHQKHVVLFGAGGVGGFAAEALARAGIGRLSVVDFDMVQESNINRQILALHNTVGKLKVEVLEERLHAISPALQMKTYAERVPRLKAETFLTPFQDADYWLDAIDDVGAKVEIMHFAHQHGIPIVSAMGAGNRLEEDGFVLADISETHHDPLARKVRKQLRERGIYQGVQVLYNPNPSYVAPSSVVATISYVPALCGLKLAAVCIKSFISA